MIFVTGGAGFIGSNYILDWFKKTDEPLLNIDSLTYSGNLENLKALQAHPGYHFCKGDIGDSKLISELLEKHKPRAILNFAAESHVDRSIHSPDIFIKTNIWGTFNLLKSALEFFDKNKSSHSNFRFLHISTDEVYGSLSLNAPSFTEESKYQPNSPYSASKASSDHFVRAFHHTYGLPVLTTNCSNNYGPFQFPEKLIPLMIVNALYDRDLPIYGDGLNIRDWLYVGDHCEAIRLVLEKGRVGEVYNVGGDCERTNNQVVAEVAKILDQIKPRNDARSYAEQIKYVTDRLGHDRRYSVNFSKLKNELSWAPKESFESGIRKTIQWYLGHHDWIENIQSGTYRDWIEANYGKKI